MSGFFKVIPCFYLLMYVKQGYYLPEERAISIFKVREWKT